MASWPGESAAVPKKSCRAGRVGRNVFQRSRDDSLRLVAQLREILAKYPS